MAALALATASYVRASAFRSRVLNLAKTCSIGLRSGEYFDRNTRRAPTLRIARRTRLSRAVPFNPLKPFDRHRFADLVAPRRCAAAHFPPLHRIDHAVTQVLRIRLWHSCWPPRKPTG